MVEVGYGKVGSNRGRIDLQEIDVRLSNSAS